MKHACNKREKAAARPRCFRLKTSGGAVTAHFGSFNSPLFFLVTNEFIHPLRSDEPAFRLNPPQSPRELERRRNNGGRHGDRDESDEETTAERDAGWGWGGGGETQLSQDAGLAKPRQCATVL